MVAAAITAQTLRLEQRGLRADAAERLRLLDRRGYEHLARHSLSPSGREIDAELAYGTRLGAGWLGTKFYVGRQPRHIAGAESQIGCAVQFTLGFDPQVQLAGVPRRLNRGVSIPTRLR